MSSHPISTFLVKVDHVLDYVPYMSTATNLVEIVAKIAFSFFEERCPAMYAEIQDNPLVNHIFQQKSLAECVLLAIPFFNILVAILRDVLAVPSSNESSSRQAELQQDEDVAQLHRQPSDDLVNFEALRAEMERSSQETLRHSEEIRISQREEIERNKQKLNEMHQNLISEIAEMDKDPEIVANPEGQRAKKWAIVKESKRNLFKMQVRATESTWKAAGTDVDLSSLLAF